MHGIARQVEGERRPYVTAGDRAYLIGSQDGGFPDMGDHVPGEMGGLWIHPIKLLDGFWASVRDGSNGREAPLSEADQLVTYPYGTLLRYEPVLGGVEVERQELSPDGHPGVVIRYRFRNTTDRARRLELTLAARTELSPVWYSEKIGITDAPDTVAWRTSEHAFVGKDTGHEWYVVWGAADNRAARPTVATHAPRTSGNGATAAARYPVSLGPGSEASLTFVFAGSAGSEAEALRAFRDLAASHASLREQKQRRYAALLERA
jgi:hypothetical protein